MLREYQKSALEQIREAFGVVKGVLLHMATGSGKTVVICEALAGAQKKGLKALVVVRGRKLVDQCHKRLMREGLPHGVLMAGHWNRNAKAPIQVCSIDTLNARGIYPPADLVIYDEAHYAVSDSYKTFASHYPDAYHLGVTATPYTEKSLRHIVDVIVKPVTMKELIEDGYLVPPIYYAPKKYDLSSVKTSSSTRDYVTKDLNSVLNDNQIIGDLVGTWKDFGENRQTIVFAVSVAHSRHIAQKFNEAGIPTEHCDADTKEDERNAVIERFVSRETKIITNVGLWCTGVDIPEIECILMARPTKSYTLYVQQIGRGTRLCGEKKNFLVLDNAGNVMRHGFVTDEPPGNIDAPEKNTRVSGVKTCGQCFCIYERFEKRCPLCGWKPPVQEAPISIPRDVDGTLQRLEGMSLEDQARQEIPWLKKEAKRKKYKQGWVYHQIKNKYGDVIANEVHPRRKVPEWVLRTRK